MKNYDPIPCPIKSEGCKIIFKPSRITEKCCSNKLCRIIRHNQYVKNKYKSDPEAYKKKWKERYHKEKVTNGKKFFHKKCISGISCSGKGFYSRKKIDFVCYRCSNNMRNQGSILSD